MFPRELSGLNYTSALLTRVTQGSASVQASSRWAGVCLESVGSGHAGPCRAGVSEAPAPGSGAVVRRETYLGQLPLVPSRSN